MYNQDMELNNQQELIGHKAQRKQTNAIKRKH